jgi:roadblock/LC7 domain-containing protein
MIYLTDKRYSRNTFWRFIEMHTERSAFLVIFFLCISIIAFSRESLPDRVISKTLVAKINLTSWIPESFIVSPDNKHVAYTAKSNTEQFVVIDGKEGRRYGGIGKGSLIFSPDSKRVAYGAGIDNKQFIVTNGSEGKRYDGIVSAPMISPDGKRLAYAATINKKRFVVIDGKEGKNYDSIGALLFSPDSKRVAYAARVSDTASFWSVPADCPFNVHSYEMVTGSRPGRAQQHQRRACHPV